MGKVGGFLDFGRKEAEHRPVSRRLKDYDPVEVPLQDAEVRAQAARCMDCGTPFCHGCGCPLSNVIPELNDLVYRRRWKEAAALLFSTSCFPEFTARVCPAPCETACVLGINDDPVSIRQIEYAIIETAFAKGYIRPRPPRARLATKVAVIGSGPAGLAAADVLNRAGHPVTVYDRAKRAGGILRYGIPDFKLEKRVVDRRIAMMENEGVVFELGVSVGDDVSYNYLRERFDAICLAGGARAPRDLKVPGRELAGVHFAMEFLVQQNRKLAGDPIEGDEILAKDKRVVVIGGGDTGSDCVGTALRQRARHVRQFEIMPEPPRERPDTTPWPMWPAVRRDSSSHEEGGERRWSVSTARFIGEAGILTGLECVEVQMERDEDERPVFIPRPGTEFEVEAELVLLALGFTGPRPLTMVEELGLETDGRGCLVVDGNHMTNVDGVFAAGDMSQGQSLVVRAIAHGQQAAEGIIEYLEGNKGRR